MKKCAFISLILLSLFTSGCVLLLVGGGVATGYSLSGDSAEGVTNASFDKTWKATSKVFNTEGVVMLQDKERGYLEGMIGGIKMKAQLTKVSNSSTTLKISGRKNLMPKAKQAGEVYTKILKQL
jgi:hypothetical protein